VEAGRTVKAVVLVGGEGTRLRPLTETIPKPLIPLVDRPFLHHVLDHLARHDVHEVILSSSYLESTFHRFIADRHGDPKITWITETSPLGTAGAIANAARAGHLEETFLVLNGDILTDLDLTALVAAHRAQRATATITLTDVDDARPFGLVMLADDSRVSEFREKPADPIRGVVNAGTYVLEPAALEGVPSDRPVSIEREVFPSLIGSGAPVHGFVSDAYWIDLGTPEKYLRATFDALDGKVGGLEYVAPFMALDALVDLRAQLGRWVVVNRRASIAEGAQVEDSVLLAGAAVGRDALVRDSILGPGSVVGEAAEVQGAVLAEGARIPAGVRAEGSRVSAGSVPEA
jgi:mannose-1-phosphate guanylyltransferase